MRRRPIVVDGAGERTAGTGDVGRLRILWLIKGLGAGGAERLLVSIARRRDGDAFDYEAAYVLPHKRAFVPLLEAEGIPVACLGGGREWQLAWAWRLRRRLLEQPVDVVHVHSPYVAAVARLVSRSLPAGRRPALVCTDHAPWSRYSVASRALNAVTYALDDAHLAVSDEVRASVPARHRPTVEVLVHGVVLDDVRAAAPGRHQVRRELGLAADEIVVGAVANFRRQKAYPNLLAAARLVLDAGASVRFVAVGQGPLEGEIRQLHVELGLGDRVLLLGPRDDPAAVLAACDLFVLASHFEGYPIAVMEAMALGLPVVSTNVGGVPQAVGHGVEGLLVPVGRPDLLAEALVELVGDHDRRVRMSAAALARSEEFDIVRAARRIEDIYRQVASTPK